MKFEYDRMNAVLVKTAVEAMMDGSLPLSKVHARAVGSKVNELLLDSMEHSTSAAQNLQTALAACASAIAGLYAVLEIMCDTDLKALHAKAMQAKNGGAELGAPHDNMMLVALLAIRSAMKGDDNPLKEAFDDLAVLRNGGRLKETVACPVPDA
jgi:hypothetical protein